MAKSINDEHGIKLVTDRLFLRDFQPSDWQDVHEFNTDPQVVEFLPSEPGTFEQTQALVQWWIDRIHDDPRIFYDLAVVHSPEQKVIGWCRFAWRTDELQQAEIAYILNRRYWGQGLATELGRALVHFGFTTMRAHRIFATVRPANTASWRVLEKIGMQREGQLRQHRWMKGAWHDSLLYAILDHEWVATSPQLGQHSRLHQ